VLTASLLPPLPFRIFRIPRRLLLRLALRRRRSRLRLGIGTGHARCFSPFRLLRCRLLRPGGRPLFAGHCALGGELLVDRRLGTELLQRLLLRLGGLAGALLEAVVVGHGAYGLRLWAWLTSLTPARQAIARRTDDPLACGNRQDG